MRNIYFIFCFLLISGTIGFFSNYLDIEYSPEKVELEKLYAVQLTFLKKPKDLNGFKGFDNVVELAGKDGFYRYCLKPFTGKDEADKLCAKVKKTNYINASVIELSDELGYVLLAESPKKDSKKFNFTKKLQKEPPLLKILNHMTDVGSEYFYSIQLLANTEPIKSNKFKKINVKEFKDDAGIYRYLHGNFADVEDAEKYLRNELSLQYAQAKVVIVNGDGVISDNYSAKNSFTEDYYKNINEFNDNEYFIELGPYEDVDQAKDYVKRLCDLGYTTARLSKNTEIRQKTRMAASSVKGVQPNYTIQILATRRKKNVNNFHKLSDVRQTYSTLDKLYRYQTGSYDNYWVCRRQLREVRNKGYNDAFIVKF